MILPRSAQFELMAAHGADARAPTTTDMVLSEQLHQSAEREFVGTLAV